MKKTIVVALFVALFAASTPLHAESLGNKIRRKAAEAWEEVCKAGEEFRQTICDRSITVGKKAYRVVEDIAALYKSLHDATRFEVGSYTVYPTLGIAIKTEKLKQYEQKQQQIQKK